jgi:hypothetical protein
MSLETLSRVLPTILGSVTAFLGCALEAAAGGGSLPPNCPASGSCFSEHAWPGCNRASCCDEVCATDPFCCESQWDAICAKEADAICVASPFGLCGGSLSLPEGSCFVVHAWPKCESLICCEIVSTIDPFCLDVEWDATCVGLAYANCPCDANLCPSYRLSFGETPSDDGVISDCSTGEAALDSQFVETQGIVFGTATSELPPFSAFLPMSIASSTNSCPDDCRSTLDLFGLPIGLWRCEFRLPPNPDVPSASWAGVTTFSADVGFLIFPITMIGYGLDGSVVASATTNEFGTVRMTLNAPPGQLISRIAIPQIADGIFLDCLSYDGPFDATPTCPNYTHSCFEAGSAGCDDEACCESACLQDPSCCVTAWDANCVTWAVTECGQCETKACEICIGGSTAECCELSLPQQPGCKDAQCCVVVCAQDGFCCATNWDQLCVEQATSLCVCIPASADGCENPEPIEGFGAFPCNTIGATTDGVDSPVCIQTMYYDVWFCWTAPAGSGNHYCEFAMCDTDFDPMLAVFVDCSNPCPTTPVVCDDDDCKPGLGPRALMGVEEGQTVRIRVGSYGDSAPGTGTLTITPFCGPGDGGCLALHIEPGCEIGACCFTVCGLDDYCCETSWDELCVQAATRLPECDRNGGGTGCDGATGSCTQIHPTPGCSDADCCASVCAIEPSCCDSGWDWFCVEAALTACAAPGCGSPFVVGATAAVHSAVTDPMQIALGADAALFTGRDAIGSGGSNSTPVKIHRAPPGGGPASEFGAVVIPDPDAVVVDVDGTLSGTPGSVLVGGQTDASGNTGQILAVRPDQSVVTVFASSTLWKDPQDMVFDGPNLLVADRIRREVRRWMPGQSTLSLLVDDLPENPTHIAVDQAGRIFVSLLDGTIRRYNPNGSGEFVVASGLPPQTPIAVGPTGPWQAGDVYAIVGEDLVRFDGESGGPPVAVGCGFTGTTRDLAFGPDGALYVSRFGNDHVMRFERPTLGAVPGDLDCNGLATLADVAILCAAVEDPAGYAADHPGCSLWATGDIDGNNVLDANDVVGLCMLLGDPRPCGCSAPSDLDGDGDVDGGDLAILLGAWGSAGPLGDLNDDNTVDAADLAILLGAWGS